jgi:hypothetical protein
MHKLIRETLTTQAVAPRLMPERTFYGAVGNHMLFGIIHYNEEHRRTLMEGERHLGAFVIPDFQRNLVWTEEQKTRLIESIYRGRPIGALVWNQVELGNECDGWLLDGQQRLSAILGFAQGEFAFKGWRFPDLPEVEKRHFERIAIPIIETRITDRTECLDLYESLVYGGTPHPERQPTAPGPR